MDSFFIKDKLKFILVVFFLSFCFSVFAERDLISLVTSRNGKVSYVNMAPLHYEAKKKGFDLIRVFPGSSLDKSKPGESRPMELVIYSTCNQGEPKQEAALGFRAQFLLVSFLMSPHPGDLPAAHYLLPVGWFRMLKEALRGHPYFQEKGEIRIAGSPNEVWELDIQRSDVTAVNPKTDYFIGFSKDMDQPLFIQALKEASKPAEDQTPQVTILLESPSLSVKATYALIHKGTKQYHTVKSINILNLWSKQQKGCPKKR